jgi:hypothetical protein
MGRGESKAGGAAALLYGAGHRDGLSDERLGPRGAARLEDLRRRIARGDLVEACRLLEAHAGRIGHSQGIDALVSELAAYELNYDVGRFGFKPGDFDPEVVEAEFRFLRDRHCESLVRRLRAAGQLKAEVIARRILSPSDRALAAERPGPFALYRATRLPRLNVHEAARLFASQREAQLAPALCLLRRGLAERLAFHAEGQRHPGYGISDNAEDRVRDLLIAAGQLEERTPLIASKAVGPTFHLRSDAEAPKTLCGLHSPQVAELRGSFHAAVNSTEERPHACRRCRVLAAKHPAALAAAEEEFCFSVLSEDQRERMIELAESGLERARLERGQEPGDAAFAMRLAVQRAVRPEVNRIVAARILAGEPEEALLRLIGDRHREQLVDELGLSDRPGELHLRLPALEEDEIATALDAADRDNVELANSRIGAEMPHVSAELYKALRARIRPEGGGDGAR